MRGGNTKKVCITEIKQMHESSDLCPVMLLNDCQLYSTVEYICTVGGKMCMRAYVVSSKRLFKLRQLLDAC